MIALPSIAFGGFSGSAKGVTARQVGGRSILSLKCWPGGPATNAQVVRRASMSKISKSWKALTAEQMQEWDRLAEHTSGQSSLGEKAKISGMNLYIRLNVNRAMAGEQLLSVAPESVEALPIAAYRLAVASPSRVVFTGIKHESAPKKLVVKMSASMSPGISNGWSKTVIITPAAEDDWGEADLTTFYTETIGVTPVVGEKIFIEVYWMDTATGFAGEATKGSVVCMTDEEAAALIGGSRARYTEEDIQETSYVSEFDMEYSTGGPAVNVEIISQGTPGVSQSEVFLNDEIPADRLGKIYVVSRSLVEGKHQFGLVEMVVNNTSYYGPYIKIRNFAGGIYKPCEIFGPGIMLPL
ncbi:MAG: hypothetical protein IJ714_07745 [Bacteroidales bacterium]|nr:hypothetical protein [Bacteroidales bacterium]